VLAGQLINKRLEFRFQMLGRHEPPHVGWCLVVVVVTVMVVIVVIVVVVGHPFERVFFR
jgi:hypothetical protein